MTVVSKLKAEKDKQLNRKRFILNLFLVLVFLCAFIFLGVWGGLDAENQKQVVGRDVQIDGIQIGGLSYKEAKKLVLAHQQNRLDAIEVTVKYNGKSHVFDAEKLGVSSDVEQKLESAYNYNKQGTDVWESFLRTTTPMQWKTELKLNRDTLYENLSTVFDKYTVAAKNAVARFDEKEKNFQYTDGEEGQAVDIDALCRDIETALSENKLDKIEAVTKIVRPQYTKEDLQNNTALIGESKTPLGSSATRRENIRTLCTKINSLRIEPGEQFSLTETIGGFTSETGFVDAPVEEDGQNAESAIGGGASQFASTLYQAALQADLGIVERRKNIWPPAYIPVGLDASVGLRKDLILENRSELPVFISASLEDSVLTISLFGEKSEYEIMIENRELRRIEAPHEEVVYTKDYPEGEQHLQSVSREGYEMEVYRHYLDDGRTVESELISHDVYKEIRGVILQGIE